MDPQQGADSPITPDGRIKVQCDTYGCLNALSTPTKTRLAVAVEFAEENGWTAEDGHIFCPVHKDIHPVLWPEGAVRDLPTPGPKNLDIPQVVGDAPPFTVDDPK